MLGPVLLVDVPAGIVGMLGQCYWWTYQRHCGMLGPGILVDVPAVLCEHWAQRFDTRGDTSPGQPTRELVGRETVFVSGNPVVFFNAAGALEQFTQELYTVSARMGIRPSWFALGFVLFSFTPSPFLFSSLFVPLLALCRRSVPAISSHFGIFGPIILVGLVLSQHLVIAG